jgi:hypothetical protein
LTRWAAFMDPYTRAYLAGHSDFSTTRPHVHPQTHTGNEAVERAQAASPTHTAIRETIQALGQTTDQGVL